jgi:DNA repair protein RadC
MPEHEPEGHRPRPAIEFGTSLPQKGRRHLSPVEMFPEGDDLPLFSGTPQEVTVRPYEPEASMYQQQMLPDMPDVDWEAVLEADRRLRARRQQGSVPIAQEGTIWEAQEPVLGSRDDTERARQLREVFDRYRIDIPTLRQLAAQGSDLNDILRGGSHPEELRHLLTLLASVFRPLPNERIRSPADAVGLLIVEMAHLDQEQLRVLCLDTKNRLQKMHMVYQGSLNSASVRIAEVYKEPVRLNSAAIIVAHNHPSGQPDPSPEDILVTRQIVEAGKLLDIECLDHVIVGQGKWVSLRERGLGF